MGSKLLKIVRKLSKPIESSLKSTEKLYQTSGKILKDGGKVLRMGRSALQTGRNIRKLRRKLLQMERDHWNVYKLQKNGLRGMHDAQELTCPLLDALRVISEIQSVRKCKKSFFLTAMPS